MAHSWPRQEYGEEDEDEEFLAPRVRPKYDPSRRIDRRIYIMGTGNIGNLVAHAISRIANPPPISLLLHTKARLEEWEAQGRTIELITNGHSQKGGSFDVELALPERTIRPVSEAAQAAADGQAQDGPIDNLILTVKAPNTISALTAIKDRLTPESTIVFLQNGMGMVEEVNEKLFPDIETRPNYMLGIITHGVHSRKSFSIVHAGMGTTSLGALSRYPLTRPTSDPLSRTPPDGEKPPGKLSVTSRYLLRTLTRTPLLAAVGFGQTDIMQLQLEKLAVNAIINPLTVMLDSKNGDLLSNFAMTRVMRLLLAEISVVIRALPELQGVPNVRMRFSPNRLESIAVSVMSKTSENLSSMLQDVRAGKQTEIDYINGYIVKKGEKMNLQCAMNYMVLQLVTGKQQMISRRVDDYVPIVNDTGSEL